MEVGGIKSGVKTVDRLDGGSAAGHRAYHLICCGHLGSQHP